jgi:hypothetical protein
MFQRANEIAGWEECSRQLKVLGMFRKSLWEEMSHQELKSSTEYFNSSAYPAKTGNFPSLSTSHDSALLFGVV